MIHVHNRETESVGRPTILLVEDEAFVRSVTSAVLESAGYTVVAVRNAAEAQQKYEQQSGLVDLLVTDIVLPGKSGRCLARRLSQLNPAMQILFMTGYSNEMELNELTEGRQKPLQKPFAASALLQTVRELLDRTQRPPRTEDCV